MHIVGHELRFGKIGGQNINIVCYGVVVLLLVRTVDC
jgi:fumarate reductase subunit D